MEALLIVGRNALGKTLYLENRARELIGEGFDLSTNLPDLSLDMGMSNKFNLDRIEYLYDVFDEPIVTVNSTGISIVEDGGRIVQPKLIEMIKLVCRDSNILILDEPEYGLSDWEVSHLISFIYRVMRTFDIIEIVTHDELFFGLEVKVKTITWCDSKPMLIDVKRYGYEEID